MAPQGAKGCWRDTPAQGRGDFGQGYGVFFNEQPDFYFGIAGLGVERFTELINKAFDLLLGIQYPGESSDFLGDGSFERNDGFSFELQLFFPALDFAAQHDALALF